MRWIRVALTATLTSIALMTSAEGARCQSTGHTHKPDVAHAPASTAEVGQSAFAAIAEVARVLMQDPETDWNRVDLERLRQHLIDMNEVALNARVTQTPVPGGLRMEVEGSGRTRDAIRRMALVHSTQADLLPGARVTASESVGGATLVVTATDAADSRAEARIRGLGFIGLLVLGSHHAPHHLALARGQAGHAGH